MNTKNVRILSVMLFGLLSLIPSIDASEIKDAPDVFDSIFRERLQRLADEKTTAFVSECLIQSGKATLVFPLGYKNGFLIAWNKEHKVANYIVLDFDRGEFKWDLGNGGVWVRDYFLSLFEELKGYPFQFLSADQLPGLSMTKSQRVCIEKMPAR